MFFICTPHFFVGAKKRVVPAQRKKPLTFAPANVSPVGDKIITEKSVVSNMDYGRLTGLRPVRNDLRFQFHFETQLKAAV